MNKSDNANNNFKNISILIVDDNEDMCRTLTDTLREDGFYLRTVGSIVQAKAELKEKYYNVVLVDLKLPDGSGLELLPEAKKQDEEPAVIILTGHASLDSAISALNTGAFFYILKPLNMNELKIVIKRALRMQKLSADNKSLLERLKMLSLKDSHTGLYNHRYLMERLKKELARARRYIFPLSLLMLDIDYFKTINDIYGHQYGDFILKELGHFLLKTVRENDIVIRYGGEEFVILQPDTNKDGAIIFAHRLLAGINNHVFDPEGKKIMLKLSIGQVSFPEDGADTVDELIGAADKALQNAKKLGRNRLSTSKKMTEKSIENLVKRTGIVKISKIKEKVSKITQRAEATVLQSIHAFAKTIEARDHYTGEHVQAMVSIVTKLGRKMKLSKDKIRDLEHAAVLHDLGKVAVSDRILHKKGKLTTGEYNKIKKHPQMGAELIQPIKSLSGVIPMILYHHERYDGLGYSAALRKNQIPIGARIVAIADTYQALISDRPYRKAYDKKEAIAIIKQGSGSQFDPKLVKLFLQIVKSKNFDKKIN